ncbi:MAG: hypothetical protein VX228_16835, partial [Pseudomonadota bacterium]|nr:hypothetical protein [Pseudomonadota bacterium]
MDSTITMTAESDCIACDAGTFCPVGSAAATPCSAGTYNDEQKQSKCKKCPAGSYQNETGATGCKPCTDGYYCTEASA